MKQTVIIFFFFLFNNLMSQITGELQLANEYFRAGEYKKAKILYEELLKEKSKNDFIYANYLVTLEKLNDLETAEKFIKKNVKKFPDQPKYKIDHYLILQKQKKNDEAQKLKEKYSEQISDDRNQLVSAYEILNDVNDQNFIITLLLKSRAKLKDPTAFAEQLANAYKATDNRESMIREMINMVKNDANDQELLKNKLQPLLDEDKDLDILQKLLIQSIQKNPDDDDAVQLLVWVLVQRKDFETALLQCRAFDKRKKLGGDQVFQLAKIAYENKAYQTVIDAGRYIETQYPNTEVYFSILMLTQRSKEEIIKMVYPVDKPEVLELVKGYEYICKNRPNTSFCAEAKRKQALLYAFYLGKKDTAITILEELKKEYFYDRNIVDRVKLDLGDLYILKGEHWESVLLYAQVVKTQKENPLGHEAKFKNAKVHYYMGEFDLAEEQLDVLKLATSREIANDALYLSLTIHMNKAEDSLQNALNLFAEADLQKFFQNLEEAENIYKNLLKQYPNDALVDDVLWNLTEIYIKKKQYDVALLNLDQILTKFSTDIFADDALFTKAELYDQKLKDPTRAMELYQKLLLDYPSSIYSSESRKRFRALRGDKL